MSVNNYRSCRKAGLRFRALLEQLEERCTPSASATSPSDNPGTGGESRDAVTVGTSVVLYSITPGLSLYRHDDATGWVKLGDNIIASSAVAETSGNAVVFALTADHALFRFDSATGWRMLGAPGTIQALGAGTDRSGLADVYVETQSGAFTRWSGSAGWLPSPIGGAGTVLRWAALANGRVAVVSADHSVFEYDDTFGWFRLTGAGFAQSLSAVNDSSGREVIFTETQDKALFRYDAATGWNRIGGVGSIASLSAGLEAAGQADVFVTTVAGDFGHFNAATGWNFVHPPGPVAETNATGAGRVYTVLADGSVFGDDDTFGFFRMTGPGFAQS